jgi:hypothetical protein
MDSQTAWLWLTTHHGGMHRGCNGDSPCEAERVTELAWAGGLFEGEGTIVLSQRSNATTKQGHVQLRMTDKESVERFTGALGLPPPILHPQRADHTLRGYRPVWRCFVSGRDEVVRVLVALYPYLGTRRRAKAREVLDYFDAHVRGASDP